MFDMGFPSWSELMPMASEIAEPFGEFLAVMAAITVASYLLQRVRSVFIREKPGGAS